MSELKLAWLTQLKMIMWRGDWWTKQNERENELLL